MKYTPEQITELLEKAQEALGRMVRGEQRVHIPVHPDDDDVIISHALKKLSQIVQQQRHQINESQKAYDNLLAEAEALGAESERLNHSLAIAVEALGLIKHQDACDIATEALDRINQADEDDIVRSMNSGPVDLEPDEASQETEGSKYNA
ncbi:hypothetical protein ACFCP7_10570 [Paenibacillus elgii]